MTASRSARTELAAALGRLNDEFGKLSPAAQDRAVARWGGIDAALDGEGGMALDAIRRWEHRHLVLFDEARRDAEASP